VTAALMMTDEVEGSLVLPALMAAAILAAVWFICCGSAAKGAPREAPHSFRSTQAAMQGHDD